MEIREFFEFHAPVLEMNEPRHNLILAIVARAASDPISAVRIWTLGSAGACSAMLKASAIPKKSDKSLHTFINNPLPRDSRHTDKHNKAGQS